MTVLNCSIPISRRYRFQPLPELFFIYSGAVTRVFTEPGSSLHFLSIAKQ